MTITINDTGISEKRRRVLATEAFASDITIGYGGLVEECGTVDL